MRRKPVEPKKILRQPLTHAFGRLIVKEAEEMSLSLNEVERELGLQKNELNQIAALSTSKVGEAKVNLDHMLAVALYLGFENLADFIETAEIELKIEEKRKGTEKR